MTTLTVSCWLEDEIAREMTGHMHSYAEAEKVKLPTLNFMPTMAAASQTAIFLLLIPAHNHIPFSLCLCFSHSLCLSLSLFVPLSLSPSLSFSLSLHLLLSLCLCISLSPPFYLSLHVMNLMVEVSFLNHTWNLFTVFHLSSHEVIWKQNTDRTEEMLRSHSLCECLLSYIHFTLRLLSWIPITVLVIASVSFYTSSNYRWWQCRCTYATSEVCAFQSVCLQTLLLWTFQDRTLAGLNNTSWVAYVK